MEIKKIFIGCDHAGVDAKNLVIEIVEGLGFLVEDKGIMSVDEPVDYPDVAKIVCRNVLGESDSFGILICGSGEGMSLAANRFSKIRANLCYDEYSAKMSRFDNNSNVLCLRAREFDFKMYEKIVKTFFETEFSGFERHQRRIDKLDEVLN